MQLKTKFFNGVEVYSAMELCEIAGIPDAYSWAWGAFEDEELGFEEDRDYFQIDDDFLVVPRAAGWLAFSSIKECLSEPAIKSFPHLKQRFALAQHISSEADEDRQENIADALTRIGLTIAGCANWDAPCVQISNEAKRLVFLLTDLALADEGEIVPVHSTPGNLRLFVRDGLLGFSAFDLWEHLEVGGDFDEWAQSRLATSVNNRFMRVLSDEVPHQFHIHPLLALSAAYVESLQPLGDGEASTDDEAGEEASSQRAGDVWNAIAEKFVFKPGNTATTVVMN